MIHQAQHRSLMCGVTIIVILAILLPTTTSWASGISVTYGGFAGSCGPTGIHIPTVTGNSTGTATFDGTVRVDSQVIATYVDSFPAGVFATHFNTPSIPAHSLPYTATWTIVVRGGQTTIVTVVCNANGSITASSSIAGGSPSSGQFFNPGDNRVDGHPGDRVAVWCNASATPPNVVVYGVSETSNGGGGFLLGQFNYAELFTAGTQGITKSAGTGNGTISAMTDGQGHFYTAWNGGQFGASGQGNFSKSFTCSFQIKDYNCGLYCNSSSSPLPNPPSGFTWISLADFKALIDQIQGRIDQYTQDLDLANWVKSQTATTVATCLAKKLLGNASGITEVYSFLSESDYDKVRNRSIWEERLRQMNSYAKGFTNQYGGEYTLIPYGLSDLPVTSNPLAGLPSPSDLICE